MSGRILAIGLLAFAFVFGVALWWFQTRAYYETVEGPGHVVVQGERLPVQDFEGIDAPTSPLKLRACFRVAEGTAPDALAGMPEARDPTPLVAPGWFDCFDARALQRDLDAGRARAVLAAGNEPYGIDRIVAVLPDGRGFLWRQINRCGRAHFDGDPVPADCPPPPQD